MPPHKWWLRLSWAPKDNCPDFYGWPQDSSFTGGGYLLRMAELEWLNVPSIFGHYPDLLFCGSDANMVPESRRWLGE